jgi:hypothetical protein
MLASYKKKKEKIKVWEEAKKIKNKEKKEKNYMKGNLGVLDYVTKYTLYSLSMLFKYSIQYNNVIRFLGYLPIRR